MRSSCRGFFVNSVLDMKTKPPFSNLFAIACLLFPLSAWAAEPAAGPAPARGPTRAAQAAPAQPQAEPEFYPWSENSDTHRMPKSLFTQIPIEMVTFTNIDLMRFVVTDQAIAALLLTKAEVDRITERLAQGLHEYRLERSKHFEPSEAPPAPNIPPAVLAARAASGAPPPPSGIEEVSFRLLAFPQEAQPIRQKLEADLQTLLGEERYKIFWLQASRYIDSEMRVAEPVGQVPPGIQAAPPRPNSYTFMLRVVIPGFQVYRMSTTQGGLPYDPAWDQYAPESFKSTLARWRKTIAEAPPAPPTLMGPRSATAIQAGSQPFPSLKPWNDRESFVELPKALVGVLRIPGLAAGGDLTAEATSAYGLTRQERDSVRDLYAGMKRRSEELEKAHLEQPDLMKLSFAVPPFPAEMAALQREWLGKLKEIVGPTRVEFLDQAVRIRPSPLLVTGGLRPEFMGINTIAQGPEWTTRGTNAIRIDATVQTSANGSQSLRFEYQEGTGRGSMSGRLGVVPDRWKHLLTPECSNRSNRPKRSSGPPPASHTATAGRVA